MAQQSFEQFDFDPSVLTATNGTVPEQSPDPFDIESLRLSQDLSTSLGVKKALLTVPVRKPSREWFVRTHPDEAYRLMTAVIELKEDREVYLVSRPLWTELAGESIFSPRLLITAINRQGVLFLWQIRLPDPSGRTNEWNKSSLEAAELARSKWIRVQANMSLGAYEVTYAERLLDPEWPDLSFQELLRIAFKDRFIPSLDHPVLRQLRGEV
jgi:hypothetical protein